MNKKIICCTILLLCLKIACAQKVGSDKTIADIYQATTVNAKKENGPLKYFLAKFKNPGAINNQKYHIVKRVSYNFYIIASPSGIASDENIATISSANSLWKATDNLLLLYQKSPNKQRAIEVVVTPNNNSVIINLKKYGAITAQNDNRIRLNIRLRNLAELLQQQYVVFADDVRKPHEELAINDIDLGVNHLSAIANNFADINGAGINVCIKENLYDNDLDLLGRTFKSFQTATVTSGHATTMATLIGGNGNSYVKGIGAAPNVKFTSSNFMQLMPDSIAVFKAFNISVQNHSYGTGIENYYGTEALAYDKQVFENDTIVHVFSSGNIGTSLPETSVYKGLKGVANLSGSFKQAKNVLVVGGTDRTNLPEDLSSSGPTFDGRIKPELVADGEDGTSGAAALVSGTVALLQQAYKKQYNQLPSAALVKSVLINSADDIGTVGVDYKTGYGKLNALEALRTIEEKRFIKGTAAAKQQANFSISIPANCKEFKITLAWNDPPATLNAPSVLINDLDLSVATPSGETLLPLTLSSYPAIDSLSKSGTRQKDTLNNTEQVILQNPVAGIYTIKVTGSKVPAGPQIFYLADQTVIANKFEWVYPSANDQLFAGTENYLRWQSSFNPTSAKISISYDHGLSWTSISDVSLKNEYFAWTAPEIFTTAILKMDINGQSQISKEFSLSKPLNLDVGYNCTTGNLLQWKPQAASTGYVVYTIKDNLLQKFASTTDTSIIIPAAKQTSSYFAISAIGNNFEGIKSYTINVATQGVGCYIKTLLANVAANAIVLNLQLGSIYNLKSISWEKMTGTNLYTTLNTFAISNTTSYQYTDNNPKKGTQYYRVKLTTIDGQIIYSNIADATFLQSNQFIVYPNPANIQLNVLSGDINNYELKLYDVSGKLSMVKSINQLQNVISLTLQQGVYIYVIELKGKVLYKGKLIKI